MNSPGVFENPCAICRAREATKLCDYVTEYQSNAIIFVKGSYEAFKRANSGPRYDTCDLPMCDECAKHITDEVDFCPYHHKLHSQIDLPDKYKKYQIRQKKKQNQEIWEGDKE